MRTTGTKEERTISGGPINHKRVQKINYNLMRLYVATPLAFLLPIANSLILIAGIDYKDQYPLLFRFLGASFGFFYALQGGLLTFTVFALHRERRIATVYPEFEDRLE